MARQALLSRTQPLRLHAIIEEGVLRRPFDSADTWVRQLQHLINCAAHPNILIQVIPTNSGPHSGLNGPFVILDYGDDTKLVHLENKTINLFLDEEEQIGEYTRTWVELQGLSYNAEKSVKLISVIATQVDRKN